MPASLTRIVTFHSRHRYWVPAWSAEENRQRFGSTSNEQAHGHAYQCAVTISGPLDPTTAMIIDLPALDTILAEEVLSLDGSELNIAVPEFADHAQQPSCEALATLFFKRIAHRLPAGVTLTRVRVSEDPTLHADCTGLP